MKTTFVSNRSIMDAMRLSMMKMQSRLVDAQKELASGRLADVGKSLGQRTGQTVSLREEHARLTTIVDTNTEVNTRLNITQDALKHMVESAQKFVGELIGARDTATAPAIVQKQAKSNLTDMVGALNTTLNGVYVFSGINTDVKPIADYFNDPAAPNRQAVANAFTTAFGPSPDMSTITAADMQAFLDGPFSDLFNDANWTSDWSSASDQNLRSRISTQELVETSTNANEVAFRKLASAYTMLADLGAENLSKDAYQVVVDKALLVAGDAISDLGKLQGNMGVVQGRVETSNETISLQLNVIATHIGALENVDPYEAETRVSTLLTQIETSYALTARIQKLSLLNYL